MKCFALGLENKSVKVDSFLSFLMKCFALGLENKSVKVDSKYQETTLIKKILRWDFLYRMRTND